MFYDFICAVESNLCLYFIEEIQNINELKSFIRITVYIDINGRKFGFINENLI